MLRTRIIPTLLLHNEALVKTINFRKFQYVGDPANTCRIFNELEVDELMFLDILASKEAREPNYTLLSEIADECFMPVSYGGGISSLNIAEKVLKLGFEKIVLNTSALQNSKLVREISRIFGSQSIVVAIDVKRSYFGQNYCCALSGSVRYRKDPVSWALEVESLGAGEILLTSIDREGTWNGFDLKMVKEITDAVSIPVIASGGAGTLKHIFEVVKLANASAVGLGSMVVYQKKGMGVLVNFPDEKKLSEII